MNYRLFKSITVLDLALVILWFVLMIAGVLINGPIVTQDDAIQLISDRSLLFTLTYANAVVFTILTTFVFVGLYRYCRDSNEELSLIGLILVPVYSILNIAVYFSQIALVPALMQIFSTGENEIQKLILTQFVQACPGSSMAVLNNLAYAILGISSIVFGAVLITKDKYARRTALFLIGNGAACILGITGMLFNITFLAYGSALGGVLFIGALIFLGMLFTGEDES